MPREVEALLDRRRRTRPARRRGSTLPAPRGRAEVLVVDALAQRLDVGAEEARLAAHQLEAVVVAGVVAPGDHHAAVGAEVVRGEVEQRRRADADVDDVRARLRRGRAASAARRRLLERRQSRPTARRGACRPSRRPRASRRSRGRCPRRARRRGRDRRRRGCRTRGRCSPGPSCARGLPVFPARVKAVVASPAVDGPPPASTTRARAAPPDRPAYVYAATDYRPRQPREIALCEKASSFDWLYTGTMAAGLVGSEYLSIARPEARRRARRCG